MKIINILKISRKYFYLFLFFYGVTASFGQEIKEKDTAFNKESKTFVAVPLITNSPAMKTGFGALGMYFFKIGKKDTLSPPSLFSLYAIYSTNNSYIIAPFGKFFLG